MGNLPTIPNIYWLYWRFALRKFIQADHDCKKLRLILGLGRSGTTWAGNTLAKSTTPLRFLEEPLFHISPKLKFNSSTDHTAIGFSKTLPENHPIIQIYRIFCYKKNLRQLLPRQFVKREDQRFELAMVKEVHGLLATEALAERLHIPILIITRNIFSIIDSLVKAQTINTPYLINEYRLVQENTFLNFYFPEKLNQLKTAFLRINKVSNKTDRLLLEKLLTSFLITEMFEIINKKREDILLLSYEDLCRKPETSYEQIAEFFTMDYRKGDYLFQKEKGATDLSKDHYSVVRDTAKQLTKPLSVINRKIPFINDFFKDLQIDIHYIPARS